MMMVPVQSGTGMAWYCAACMHVSVMMVLLHVTSSYSSTYSSCKVGVAFSHHGVVMGVKNAFIQFRIMKNPYFDST